MEPQVEARRCDSALHSAPSVRDQRLYRLGVTALLLFGAFAVRGMQARPATQWMNIYHVDEFTSFTDVLQYLRNLQTGIPPLLSAIEVVSQSAFDTVLWWVRYAYRGATVLMFVLPLYFVSVGKVNRMVCLSLSFLFVAATAQVALGNPEVYDVWFAIFAMGYFIASDASFRDNAAPARTHCAAFIAGTMLACLELTRPFIVFVVPFLIAYNLFHYSTHNRVHNRRRLTRRLIYFLLPILLLSGGWHTKLWLLNDGQFNWSNHAGSNLAMAWQPVVDANALGGALEPEEPRRGAMRWTHLDTDVHRRNSQARRHAVFEGVIRNPKLATELLSEKVLHFMSVPTDMYQYQLRGPLITVYQWVGRFLFVGLLFLLVTNLVRVARDWQALFATEVVMTFYAAFVSFVSAIGGTHEGARFVIPVLPFLIVVADRIITRFSRPTTTTPAVTTTATTTNATL